MLWIVAMRFVSQVCRSHEPAELFIPSFGHVHWQILDVEFSLKQCRTRPHHPERYDSWLWTQQIEPSQPFPASQTSDPQVFSRMDETYASESVQPSLCASGQASRS